MRHRAKLRGIIRVASQPSKIRVSRERLIVHAIEAIMQHCKTASIARLDIENVDGLARYFIDTRATDNLSLTGENSVVSIRDYLDQAADIGRAVPASIKRSLLRMAAALQNRLAAGSPSHKRGFYC